MGSGSGGVLQQRLQDYDDRPCVVYLDEVDKVTDPDIIFGFCETGSWSLAAALNCHHAGAPSAQQGWTAQARGQRCNLAVSR